jgi:hypothetical protein
VGTGSSFPRDKAGGVVKLTTHLQLVQRLITSGGILSLARIETDFTFEIYKSVKAEWSAL